MPEQPFKIQCKWHPFCEALFPTISPTKCTHDTHKPSPLPPPLCSALTFPVGLFISTVHPFEKNLSENRGLILVSPVQIHSRYLMAGGGSPTAPINLQSSCLNQISFAINMATYKVSISHNHFFLDTTKLYLTHNPKINCIQWNFVRTQKVLRNQNCRTGCIIWFHLINFKKYISCVWTCISYISIHSLRTI